jgi:hypothetical protein
VKRQKKEEEGVENCGKLGDLRSGWKKKKT